MQSLSHNFQSRNNILPISPLPLGSSNDVNEEGLEKLQVNNRNISFQEPSPSQFNSFFVGNNGVNFEKLGATSLQKANCLPLTPEEQQVNNFNDVSNQPHLFPFDICYDAPPLNNHIYSWPKRRPSFMAEAGVGLPKHTLVQRNGAGMQLPLQSEVDSMLAWEPFAENQSPTETSPRKRSYSTPNALAGFQDHHGFHNQYNQEMSQKELARLRNREAAKRSRLRKKSYSQDLEARVRALTNRVVELEEENSALRASTKEKNQDQTKSQSKKFEQNSWDLM